MERPHNFVWSRRTSRCFGRVAALGCGASYEFCSESTTFSLFWVGGGAGAWSFLRILVGVDDPRFLNRAAALAAGAWSVLRFLFGIDDPLTVLGGRRCRGAWSVRKILLAIDDPFVIFSWGSSAGARSVLRILARRRARQRIHAVLLFTS